MPELRWNPLLGEWLATATPAQNRAFRGPSDLCPFCPTGTGGSATEIPEGPYDIVVFEKLSPAFRPNPPSPAVAPTTLYAVRPGQGVSEVVVYSPDHSGSLGREPVEQVYKLVRVWTDRFETLGRLDYVKYVFISENDVEAVGAASGHPFGQIKGYPFVPPRVARELEQSRLHENRTGRCLICDIIGEERRDGRRVVAENDSFVAYVPFFARWPYELHVSPSRHLQALTDLSSSEQRDLATILKAAVSTYDGLFGTASPYMMALHQRPTDGHWYDYYHFHVELYPPLRTATKLKYLAGGEIGAPVNDTLAEETAAELRQHIAPVVWGSERKRL
jgi:UDPglucose--hexose-1-phosphate uridylyltransferase